MAEKTVPFGKLTKKEMKHLREEAGVRTLSAFKVTAAAQKQMRDNGQFEPCYECKNIARRLGLEV